MSHSVIVDWNRCVGCGLCKKDCVSDNFEIENGKAVLQRDTCIFCGHCEAVCPQGAISMTGFTDEPIEFEQDTRLDPETLLKAIQTRRTVRIFKETPVPKKVIRQIIEAGRLAPTGGNSQNISYIILHRRKDEMEGMAVGMFRKLAKAAKPLSAFIRNMNLDDNFFFKKAPLVIVITSNSAVNASLAAQNMAFMAEANGLGVLFSGFFTMCANNNRKIRKQLKIKPGHKAITTLVIGYPGVRYHRTARREDADVRVL